MAGRPIPMTVKRAIVEVMSGEVNVAEFCREHGISRDTFYRLRRRYREEGEAGLKPRSTAAKTVRNRTPVAVGDEIVALRKELADEGLDAGAATIGFHLGGRLPPEVTTPSDATIWRVLCQRGFVTPQPEKAPKHAYRSFQADRANELWQLDDFEWRLADLTLVYVVSIVDDCTRVCPRLKAVASPTGEALFGAFCEGAERWGWPRRFLSDNHNAYRYTLARAVAELGVDDTHGRPYHPQTQGKVERLHQTVQQWLRKQSRAVTIEELQTQLDEFCEIYNNQRPHRAIGRRIPTQVFAETPKSGPADRPLGETTRVHRVTVRNGVCDIGNRISGRYSITIGNVHDGKTATVIITGTACHIFINTHQIRHLTLDPTRRYQPLHPRPGRPT